MVGGTNFKKRPIRVRCQREKPTRYDPYFYPRRRLERPAAGRLGEITDFR
jgi:hypothetical protein